MDLTMWLQIAMFAVLLGLSAFFSSSETALFSLSSSKLEQLRRDNHPRIGLIQQMLSRPRRLIVTILIGNELVNVSASAISAAILIDMLGAENKWMNLFVMVPLLLLVGEITPKTLAIYHNAAFAGFQSYPLELFARIIKPLRWTVRQVSDLFITRIIGKKPSGGNIITEDMVRTLAYEAVGEGALDFLEAQFIDHIFDFGNKRLKDIVTLRSDIFALPIDMRLSQVVEEVSRTRYTKIPIYQSRSKRQHCRDSTHQRLARDAHQKDLGRGTGVLQIFAKTLLRARIQISSETVSHFPRAKAIHRPYR
jgi:putative hemolysin